MKKIYLLMALVLFFIGANAQITLTLEDFDVLGKEFISNSQSFDEEEGFYLEDFEKNDTLDLSLFETTQSDTSFFMSPEDTGLAESFPEANFVLEEDGSYMFFKGDENAVKLIGLSWVEILNGVEFEFDDPFTYIAFPTTLNTVSSDEGSSTITGSAEMFGFSPEDGVDSISIKYSMAETYVADKYTVVILPKGSFETLRLKREVILTFQYAFKINGVGWFADEAEADTSYNYSYFAKKQGHELASIETNLEGQVVEVSYLDNPTQPITFIAKDEPTFKFYPNPVHNTLNIDGSGADIVEIYNVSGKCVLSKNLTESKNSISVESLTSGVYFCKVKGKKKTKSVKFLKK